MANTVSGGPVVRFGEFQLDLQSGELAHNGSRLLLADQPFRLLAILIRERGTLVTREDLRRELWPEGTFVDFEPSLNAAVKRVREALGDSAVAPRFIETLPKRGYRFIATVEKIGLLVPEKLVPDELSAQLLQSVGSPPDVGGTSVEGQQGLTHDDDSRSRDRTRGFDRRWVAVALGLG